MVRGLRRAIQVGLNAGQEQLDSADRRRAVVKTVAVSYVPFLHDGTVRELLPGQVDVDIDGVCSQQVPEMLLLPDSRPGQPLDDLLLRVQQLEHSGRGIALTQHRIPGLLHAHVGGRRIPRRFERLTYAKHVRRHVAMMPLPKTCPVGRIAGLLSRRTFRGRSLDRVLAAKWGRRAPVSRWGVGYGTAGARGNSAR